jgi:predicted permease
LTELIRLFAENILPIALVAAAGFALQRLLGIDPRPVSRIAFYLCTPALVFSLLVSTQIQAQDILRMMAFAALVMAIMAGLSWAATRALRLPAASAAAFVLAATFMNAGNYGLSLNKFAFGDLALAWASLFYITSSMLTNSVGVYIATVGRASPRHALLGLAKVPAVYALPLALAVRALGRPLPIPIARPIDLLASAAVPLMLILLGMQLAKAGIPRNVGLLSLTAALRLLVAPTVAWALAPLLGMTGAARQAGILEAAMPTAVFNTILAVEFNVEPEFVTGAVLASTLLSPITLTPLIGLLGG